MDDKKNKNFKWKGPQVRCNNPEMLNGKYDYYESCTVNNETFILDDFAIIYKPNSTVSMGVYRILTMYESHEWSHKNERFRGSVTLYPFARDLARNIIPNGVIFDKENEVIEDFHITDVSLEHIQKKCYVVLATLDDPIHLITKQNLDKKIHFSCRYKLHNATLIPILSDSNMDMFTVFNEFYTNVESTPSSRRKTHGKLTSNKRLNESDDSENRKPTKMRSPNAKSSTTTPNRKVKRNLNESFDSVPNSQESTPNLNYSVIDLTADDEDSIKLKLRISEKQNPLVLLNRLKNVRSPFLKKQKEKAEDPFNLEILKENPATYKSLQPNVLVSRLDKNAFSNYQTKETDVRKSARKGTRNMEIEIDTIDLTHFDLETQNDFKLRQSQRLLAQCFVTPTKSSSFDNDQSARRRSTRNVNKPRKYCDSDDEESPKKIKRSARVRQSDSVSDDKCTGDDVALAELIPHTVETPSKLYKSSLKRNHVMTPKKSVYYEDENFGENEKIPTNNDDRMSKTPKRKTDGDNERTSKTPKHKINVCDEYLSKTPKHKINVCDEYVTKTPSTPKQNHLNEDNHESKTPASTKKNTPSARAKMIRDGVITPSVQARATPIKTVAAPLNKARIQLHVSYVPKALPCREKEFADIFNFLEGKLLDGCGGCMYVSGVPGTGKTATVFDIVKKLHALVQSGRLPKFDFVGVNGMKLSEPRQAYVEILKQLTGKTVHWEQAQSILDTKFTKPTKKCLPIVLLVDEIDVLCTKRQDVVYNLLDWPTKANTQLIVVTIANTMDLPERLLMGRITSRLGLTRLTFQAYSHKQLQEIVTKRLTGADTFNPDAIQLVARKVASVSGDARRALDICRRAAELAELEGKNTVVSIGHVDEALNAMITQPKVRSIKNCSRLQQLILQAVVAEVQRTGVEETNFIDVYTMLTSVAALDGFQMVSCTVALSAVSRLGGCRLLLTDQKSVDINQKLILNVSPDDVYYALRKD